MDHWRTEEPSGSQHGLRMKKNVSARTERQSCYSELDALDALQQMQADRKRWNISSTRVVYDIDTSL